MRSVLVIAALSLSALPAVAQEVPPPAVPPSPASPTYPAGMPPLSPLPADGPEPVQTVRPILIPGGPAVLLDGLRARLLRVIPPGADDSVGHAAFTEYVFEIENTLADRELRLGQPALTVAGTMRRPPTSAAEIMQLDRVAADVQRQAQGMSLLHLLGSFLPGAGALIAAQAGAVGTVVAQSHWQQQLVANPRAWAAELQKRAFQNVQGGDVLVLPGETARGSLWIRQSATERASRLHLFVRRGGGEGRLVTVDLGDNLAGAVPAVPASPVPME